MINILLIFIIVIIIIIFFYIINKSLVEKFIGFNAAHPNDNYTAWTTSSTSNYDFSNYCTPGIACSTENGWGVFNNNCECIIPGVRDKLEQDYVQLEEQEEEEVTINYPNIPTNNLDGCIINNQNFDKYCKSIDPTYGIKNIKTCDPTHSKVECGAYYINGTYYGENTITPCLNKSDDFDTWCKFYNNKEVPDGFNVNSIGVEKVLEGAKGGCFLNNGTPDFSKARGICNYNNIDSVKKLDRSNDIINYNVFTTCLPTKNTNFVSECATLLDEKMYEKTGNTDSVGNTINISNNVSSDECKLLCNSNKNCYGFAYNKNNAHCYLKNSSVINASTQDDPNYDLYINDKNKNSRAVEIMGYDCNPGFARAKCIKKDDVLFVNFNWLYKSIFDNNNS